MARGWRALGCWGGTWKVVSWTGWVSTVTCWVPSPPAQPAGGGNGCLDCCHNHTAITHTVKLSPLVVTFNLCFSLRGTFPLRQVG